jgi:large subunit ribosomal protein L22
MLEKAVEARAIAKNKRVSPRKMKLVADLIRGKTVREALLILISKTNKQKLSYHLLKVLNSVIKNAKDSKGIDEVSAGSLIVKFISIDQGRTMKRSRPESKGRTHPIKKRSSRITIILAESKEKK